MACERSGALLHNVLRFTVLQKTGNWPTFHASEMTMGTSKRIDGRDGCIDLAVLAIIIEFPGIGTKNA